MRVISISRCCATAADCGWACHSAAVRTNPAQPPASWIASSRSTPFQMRAAASMAARSIGVASTLAAAAAWFAKLQ
jgi:hypothetical protein